MDVQGMRPVGQRILSAQAVAGARYASSREPMPPGFTGPSLRFAEFTDAYQPVRAALIERYAHALFGDPARVAEAILAIVNDPKPPRRVLLGGEYDMIMDLYRQRQEEWQAWRHLSRAAG
jgi:hypothetical protein